MHNILLVDASTPTLSVSLAYGNKIVSHRERQATREHAALMLTFVDEVISEANLKPSQLDAVAISRGPGSYTGLRIGTSTAKGLCYAIEKPLISVCPLQAMAVEASSLIKPSSRVENTLFCSMIDAGRMEVYSGIYDINGNIVRKIEAQIVDSSTYAHLLCNTHTEIIFAGNGVEKCTSILEPYKNATLLPHITPNSRYLAPLAYKTFKLKKFENLAYFTPFYLKDFVAGKPNVKGLRPE